VSLWSKKPLVCLWRLISGVPRLNEGILFAPGTQLSLQLILKLKSWVSGKELRLPPERNPFIWLKRRQTPLSKYRNCGEPSCHLHISKVSEGALICCYQTVNGIRIMGLLTLKSWFSDEKLRNVSNRSDPYRIYTCLNLSRCWFQKLLDNINLARSPALCCRSRNFL